MDHSNSIPQLDARLAAGAGDTRPRAFLLSTGALNPVHSGHVGIMAATQAALEAAGWWVVAGFLSPSHDDYVQHKMARAGAGLELREVFAPAKHRLALVDLACASTDWLAAAGWECGQPGFVDFPSVSASLHDFLSAHGALRARVDVVVYECGMDHFLKCRLARGISGGRIHVAVVGRDGSGEKAAPASPAVHPVSASDALISSLSSTAVRDALNAGRPVDAMVPPAVAVYVREHGLYHRRAKGGKPPGPIDGK